MYAVTGSTGQVGGAVVRALRAQGKDVRALIRDESKKSVVEGPGVEAFVASVSDPSHLEQAFERTEGVFIMTPPLYGAVDPRAEHMMILAALKHAALASHTPRVVLLSSIGAQAAEGSGPILKLHDMEEQLLELPLNIVSIRAAYFMENLLPGFGIARESGKLPVMLSPIDRAIPMIATRDIGELAARLLTETWEGKRIIELEGPREYSMQDAAVAFSQLLARPVEASLVPLAEQKPMFLHLGMSEASAESMVEMSAGLESGLIAFEGGAAVEHRKGTTTLEQVFEGR